MLCLDRLYNFEIVSPVVNLRICLSLTSQNPLFSPHKVTGMISSLTSMSTSSMVTVSVKMYLTLCNCINIGNQICILIATQGDGTLLCPSSFREEDIAELCVGLAQEHPRGVLWLFDTEAVLAFQCQSNMMAPKCHLTVAMIWWGKPIILHILPPKGR